MNFKFGIISEAKTGFAKVSFIQDDFVTDWLPIIYPHTMKDKIGYVLNVKEHVACIMDENCEEGLILGAIHSTPEPADTDATVNKFRRIFEDGTLIEYDKSTHKLLVDVQGNLEAKTTGSVKIDAGTTLEAKAAQSVKVDAGTTLEATSGTSAKISAGTTLEATAEESVKIDAGTSLEATSGTTAKIDAGTTLIAKAGTSATVEAATIELKGAVTVTGTMNVTGAVTVTGALAAAGISATGGTAITSTGDITTTGDITANDVKAGVISLKTHKHPGVQTGAGQTGLPL